MKLENKIMSMITAGVLSVSILSGCSGKKEISLENKISSIDKNMTSFKISENDLKKYSATDGVMVKYEGMEIILIDIPKGAKEPFSKMQELLGSKMINRKTVNVEESEHKILAYTVNKYSNRKFSETKFEDLILELRKNYNPAKVPKKEKINNNIPNPKYRLSTIEETIETYVTSLKNKDNDMFFATLTDRKRKRVKSELGEDIFKGKGESEIYGYKIISKRLDSTNKGSKKIYRITIEIDIKYNGLRKKANTTLGIMEERGKMKFYDL